MDKITKLSQAIRLGATFRPQGQGSLYRFNEELGTHVTCALGAAMEAVGLDPDPANSNVSDNYMELVRRFPILARSCLHPIREFCAHLDNIIPFLNDRDGWTREQIADWLEEKGF